MKTLKNKLLVALVVAFMLTLGAAIIPTVGMQVNAAETDSVQITLTDGIAVKYYATLGADVTTATATFESETTALNATVKGEKIGDKWLFVYNKVTPQYVDKTFSIAVNGEVRKENYSVLEYLNTIINGEYAQAEKTVAKDLVYYGEAAKAYKFGGEVTATPGTEYKGESKMSLGAKFADDTTIYSATVVFDTLPAITFGFKKASETATVTVDGKDVTNELVAGENGVYTYTLTGIYAVEFDKQYNVVLTDGDKTQTLLYSINDYAARMQNSANEAMKTLAKALYCYGAGAQALKTYQSETYTLKQAPTNTQPGILVNTLNEEKTIPALNFTDYTASYSSEKIIFIHKETNLEVAQVAINVAETVIGSLTVNYAAETGYKFIVAANGVVELNGNINATTFSVKSGASVNVTGNVTIREEMLVESGATFNITAKTDTLCIEDDGKLKLYGSMTLTDATGGHAAIYLKNNSTLDISKDTRINIVNYTYAIGKFVNNDSTGRKANIEMPYSAALVDKSITLAEKKLIDASTCENFYTNWSIVFNKKEPGKYSVVEEPTFTKTGLAQSDGGDEMILPILNAANYNFMQKTKDGADYAKDDYAKGTLGTATFTHKTNPEIVIEKEITADTITFNWADYNNVDIHWLVASRYKGKMTGAYVDGTYVLTLLNGVTIDIPNLNSRNSATKTNVKITGDGTFNITSETQPSSFENVTVDNVSFTHNGPLSAKSITVTGDKAKATLNKTFNGSVIVKAGELTINEQLTVPANGTLEVAEKATLNVTASSGDVVRLGSNTEGVTADLYGAVNITYTGTASQTGLWLGVGSVVNLGDESRVAIKGADFSVFVQQNGTSVENAATLYYPSGATLDKDNKKITNKDGKVIFDYDNNVLRLDFKQK